MKLFFKMLALFAKGRNCPYCKGIMYAQDEVEASAGNWVVYVCRNGNCGHKEKVFEEK
jgi:hypothetical protein